MTNREKAIKELEEIRKRTDELEKIINEPEIKSYPVETPVDSDGDILFNDNKQILHAYAGTHRVSGCGIDCREDFVWVPCERSELKAGDTAYRTNWKREAQDNNFGRATQVCKILDANKHVYIEDTNITVSSVSFDYWYKLVEKDTL